MGLYTRQGNSLFTAITTLMYTGIFVGSTNFVPSLPARTLVHSDVVTSTAFLLFYLSAIIGSIAGSTVVERYEKKTLSLTYLLLVAVSATAQLAAPFQLITLCFSRVFAGLAHGITYLVVIVHTGEIMDKRFRGALAAFASYAPLVGMLVNISLEGNSNEFIYRLIGAGGVAFAAFAFFFGRTMLHESPIFLVRKGRQADAVQALMKLRLANTETLDVRIDYAEIEAMLNEEQQISTSIFRDGNLRPLTLLMLCKIVSVLSFNLAINSIRIVAGGHVLGTGMSSLVLLLIRMVVGFGVMNTVDKFGRRLLFTIAASLAGCILVVFGIVNVAVGNIHQNVAIAVFLAYEAISGAGVTLVPDAYLSEAFPTKKKARSIALVHCMEFLFQSVVVGVVILTNINLQTYVSEITISCGVPMIFFSTVLFIILPETACMTLRGAQTEFIKYKL